MLKTIDSHDSCQSIFITTTSRNLNEESLLNTVEANSERLQHVNIWSTRNYKGKALKIAENGLK